jgi:hypothetical protein
MTAAAVLAGDAGEKSRLVCAEVPAAVVVLVVASRISTCQPATPAAAASTPRSEALTPARSASSSAALRPGTASVRSAPGPPALADAVALCVGDGVAGGGDALGAAPRPIPMPRPRADRMMTAANTSAATRSRREADSWGAAALASILLFNASRAGSLRGGKTPERSGETRRPKLMPHRYAAPARKMEKISIRLNR